MKIDKYLLTIAALLLVWSLRSEAHGSLEAMQNSSNWASLTVAMWHPFMESPYWLAVASIPLLLMGMLRRKLSDRVLGPASLAARSEPTSE